jgi:hypothetical protein
MKKIYMLFPYTSSLKNIVEKSINTLNEQFLKTFK